MFTVPAGQPDPEALPAALADFVGGYPFGLDPFQIEACTALEAGDGVLVAAPTGAGKTIVGEFAAHLALTRGERCFYTTPIKALSNQKYTDLVARHGGDAVGLLTGDTSRNPDAPVVVMTTEVLRNMLYTESAGLDRLGRLAFVVMDEVHYLADRQRGAVWEEVIIHLPRHVHLVSLSATVSNAEEFADWLVTVRGHTRVVVTEHRPVPLWQHVLAGRDMYDLFVDGGPLPGDNGLLPGGGGPLSIDEVLRTQPDAGSEAPAGRPRINPDLVRLSREESRRPERLRGRPGGPGRGGPPPRRTSVPNRPDVISQLDRSGLLPAITFVFSRAGCDAAVAACVRAGLRLTTPDERDTIRGHVRSRTSSIPSDDLRVLGYWEWLEGLERGIAAHHAGMLPTFKEVVEELFVRGLVRAVFATETLALGINMPARTVVLERLSKFNGETRAEITPGEYTQLTGRAGRRGIDVEGHAVVLWQPGFDPVALAGLASARTYPLRSSFRPSYNMAVNLVGRLGRAEARSVLESSFAQFQADRAVVGLARQVRRNSGALDELAASMACEQGSVAGYSALRDAIRAREAELSREGSARRRTEAVEALSRLRVGDVVRVPAGRRSGLAVVLDPGVDGHNDGPRPVVLTADRQVRRLSLVDFPVAVEAVGRVRVPKTFNPRSPHSRRDLASFLHHVEVPPEAGRRAHARAAAADDAGLARLRRELRAHPVHGCPDREAHMRVAERHAKLRRDTDTLERRIEGRTNTVAKIFDRVCATLETLGYLHGDTVTGIGAILGRIYTEQDLLVAECLRDSAWDGLSPAALAAAVSTLVYEPRGEETAAPKIPGDPGLRDALAATARLAGRLRDVEADHRLDFLRLPEPGFVWVAFGWASGLSLEKVLTDSGLDLTAGDFVRWMRQLIDLLDQIVQVAPEGSTVRGTARTALNAVRRGVVAYSMSI
ncbi:DEAD/DEAH box helicase [Frankia sp. Cppng1_Ct_nod]|uniref:DEAD/DEAH box helicase n=1 Tax=Frankia sp. Cppng1_Ct_nod TaxID=2897162 RepID=UPI0020254252|nr:DEAD/DEAH box helicase [Frankia sp. Cppng1_Ct_nod]